MKAIQNYFNELTGISESDSLIFCSKLQRVDFSRKSIILERGKTEKNLSFIEKGIVRFNIPKLDYDFTFAFAFENSFVSAYDSFLTQQPSIYNMEAISDCVLWQISFDELNDVYENTRIGDRIGRKVAENIYLKKMKREISLLEDTAKKKIPRFNERAAPSYSAYSAQIPGFIYWHPSAITEPYPKRN